MKKSIIAAVLMLSVASLASAGVVGTPHDLTGGSGQQVCVFCHTPHNANTNATLPLWSHAASTNTVFQPYNNVEFSTVVGLTTGPGAISMACLSCHDGSIAVGYVANGAFASPDGGVTVLASTQDANTAPSVAGKMMADSIIGAGGDLRTTHPIGIAYPTDAANFVQNPLNVKLFKEGSTIKDQVECASCHEPHTYGADTKFLRVQNSAASALCLTCHVK